MDILYQIGQDLARIERLIQDHIANHIDGNHTHDFLASSDHTHADYVSRGELDQATEELEKEIETSTETPETPTETPSQTDEVVEEKEPERPHPMHRRLGRAS